MPRSRAGRTGGARGGFGYATALHGGRDEMSEARTGSAICCESGSTAATGVADWLYLAAAPTFAIMALLTAVSGGGSPLCSMASASPLTGMVPIYLLMSAFHLPPWLKLISGWRGRGRQS